MRIVRIVTVCAALMSMFLGAETVRSNRRPQPKDYMPQVKPENGTDPNEITFTTLRPEPRIPNHKVHSNVYVVSHKRFLRAHPSHSISIRPRGLNRFKGNRRRRQLQHQDVKSSTSHAARSYDLNENHLENQQIEAVQGPAEAFDDGAVHIEPIYRVTKNKNIFDSIVDIIRRIVNPPKSLGPLVGPFQFPGIGDKVYIRLLESHRPDNLVIRLVSHVPVTEIESTFDKDVLPVSEILEHAEIPSIEHDVLPLSNDELVGSFDHHSTGLTSPDSLVSSSNNMVQVSKSPSGQTAGHVNGNLKGSHGLNAYNLYLKQGNVNGVQRVVRHRKRNPSTTTTSKINRVNSAPRLKLEDRLNKTQNGRPLRATGFQNSLEPMYPFYSPLNESNKENLELLGVDYHQFHNPMNVSTREQIIPYPTSIFEAFPIPQIVSPSQIPTSIGQRRSKSNSSNESGEDRPSYSLRFTSKDMKYLNMDGSVESVVREDSSERSKPDEIESILSNVPRSVDQPWIPLKATSRRTKEVPEVSTIKQNSNILQARSDDKDNEFLGTLQKSKGERTSYLRNAATNGTAIKSEEQGSRCCSKKEEENKGVKSKSDERHEKETTVNNLASSVTFLSNNGSMNSPLLKSFQRV